MNEFLLQVEQVARPAGFSQHERVAEGKDEWLTPSEYTQKLGPFDLDPCSPINRPWDTAKEHFTILDNGLAQKWTGRIWLNPPYGNETERWMKRLAEHGNGIALIFARTDTATWHDSVWPFASGILFVRGRIAFCHVDGRRAQTPAGAPSAFVAYGSCNSAILKARGPDGYFVSLR